MLPVNASCRTVKSSQPFSREAEGELDFHENQQRSKQDVWRVDAAFVGGSSLVTLLWAVMWTGVVGGMVAVGTTLMNVGQ